ncbi:hypothetical protein LWI29_010799 [Acer saccharum]|uniref:DUF4283 domain-containing protein n=1 Tax=Acer saccharum TaxID=4024 RepID=A0AA39RWW0_ACESA|nr:hypothetical protein LWI29_010799 [Acer saccharum]
MKSYAQAISSAIAPISSAPKKKGDYVAIKVNPKAYEERLKLCSYSLIGRVVLSKGEEPWKILALKEKLQSIWKLNSQWRLISLGRGFFQILLNSEEDKAQVWGIGSLHLKPGILRLQPWTQNFNPNTQRTTNAQIWVRFYDLPWEFWHPQILSDMARGVGIPLKFDRATLEGDYGHFARMLIDVDLSKPLPDSIMIEARNVKFVGGSSHLSKPREEEDMQERLGYRHKKGQSSSYADALKDKVDERITSDRVSSDSSELLITDSLLFDGCWLEKSAMGVLKSFSNIAIVKKRLINIGFSCITKYLWGGAILWSFDSIQDCEGFISNSFFFLRDLFSSMEKWSAVRYFDKRPIWFNFTGVALDFRNEAFLKKLGSMIGVFMLVDEDTLFRKRLDMARILLMVSPNKVHPKKIKVVYSRRNFYVIVETEPSQRD